MIKIARHSRMWTCEPSEMSFRELRAYERDREEYEHACRECRWLIFRRDRVDDGRLSWALKLPWWGIYRDHLAGRYRRGQKVLRYCPQFGFRLTEFFG